MKFEKKLDKEKLKSFLSKWMCVGVPSVEEIDRFEKDLDEVFE